VSLEAERKAHVHLSRAFNPFSRFHIITGDSVPKLSITTSQVFSFFQLPGTLPESAIGGELVSFAVQKLLHLISSHL